VFSDDHVAAALYLLELCELAWHDCYEERSVPQKRASMTFFCSAKVRAPKKGPPRSRVTLHPGTRVKPREKQASRLAERTPSVHT
jgi:hypothetical protein